MTPKLTTDQRQAIEEQNGRPVYVLDADTNSRRPTVEEALRSMEWDAASQGRSW